jgi:hypothetical protein
VTSQGDVSTQANGVSRHWCLVEGTRAPSDDLELLRRFEPVLRLTSGEMFRPVSAEEYLAHAALLHGSRSVLCPAGTITPQRLADIAREHRGEPLALRYVSRPLSRREYREWVREGGRPPFRASSAATAVGLVGRLLAAVTALSLIVRGRVPGGWSAAASEQQRRTGTTGTCHYYGRVTRDAGYVSLQYWFLYPMNDWRSSFGGVNDHEADWEQITVFVAEDHDGALEPRWVAFSSHDERGADLRRRVDDPDLEWHGRHPVVYVGAGSHSGAYLPGEYLVTVPLVLPGWLASLRRRVLRVLPWGHPDQPGISVPYLDYRRGDGESIGPGQHQQWHAGLVDDDTPWVRDYRGLWGLDTGDPLGGERAPAGPRYERDGTVRRSWAQPVGWAALDSVPPRGGLDGPVQLEDDLRLRRAEVEDRLERERDELRRLATLDRVRGRPVVPASAAVQDQQRVVSARRDDLAAVDADLDAVAAVPDPPAAGVHDHLHHRALPLDAARPAAAPLRLWASISTTLIVATLGLVLLIGEGSLVAPLLAVAGVAIAIEAVLRGQLLRLLVSIALTAAVLGVGYLLVRALVENVRDAAGVLLVVVAGYLALRAFVDAATRHSHN